MSLNETSIVMNFEPLSTSQRRGAIVVAVFALLSALALTFVALRTIRFAMMVFLKRDSSTSRQPEILFFRTQIGHYAGCLVLSNMFISVAGLFNFSWVSRSGLSQGSTCSAQAMLIQIGLLGTCFFTAAHGVHTFISLGLNIRPARWRSLAGVALGWSFTGITALAPLRENNVYGPAGTSCSVTPSYPRRIFILQALPIILGAVVSTAVYSAIFIILHGKLSANSTQKLRESNSANPHRDDGFEEYYKFISVIIRTMFWFPLAFVVLLLPFCVTHILTYAGYSVPTASSVFADVCASMLGFVNVVLLCNTFRVISPVYRGPRVAKIVVETVTTFGHDASGESPVVPRPAFGWQSATSLHESGYRSYKPAQSALKHSHTSSCASVDSNTELVSEENASYELTLTKAAAVVLDDAIPLAGLNREPGIAPLQSDTDIQDIDFHSETVVIAPLRTASVGSSSHTEPVITVEDVLYELAQMEVAPTMLDNVIPLAEPNRKPSTMSLRNRTDTQDIDSHPGTIVAPLHMASVGSYRPRVPLVTVDAPPEPSVQDGKYLSLPIADTDALVARVPTLKSSKFRPPSNLSRLSVPRSGVASWYSEHAHDSKSRPCSFTSMEFDSDSDYSCEIMYVRRVRPLPQIPQRSYYEQGAIGSQPIVPRRQCHMSMSTIWSQESGHELSLELDVESQEHSGGP